VRSPFPQKAVPGRQGPERPGLSGERGLPGRGRLCSCYYEFKYHVPSDRRIRRLLVSGLVADIHKRSRGTYGMLRIRAALLREQNMVVNKKLIRSIMRELGIKGLPGPKKRRKNLVNQATEEDLVSGISPWTGPTCSGSPTSSATRRS
jgi:hypothetical protein